MPGPLDGVRVFDLTLWMVGPWASTQLGALGADVIHIEQPAVDPRTLGAGVPPTIDGTSIGYMTWNQNKRGLFLDLKSPTDRQTAYELLQTCDVFLINMRPGAAERMGVGYEQVKAVNPDIIYTAITGWGEVGPMRDRPGADVQAQYFTGFWSVSGAEGGRPEVYRHMAQIDATTGNVAAQAVLMGLLARKRTGEGQRIHVGMLRAGMALQSGRIAEARGLALQNGAFQRDQESGIRALQRFDVQLQPLGLGAEKGELRRRGGGRVRGGGETLGGLLGRDARLIRAAGELQQLVAAGQAGDVPHMMPVRLEEGAARGPGFRGSPFLRAAVTPRRPFAPVVLAPQPVEIFFRCADLAPEVLAVGGQHNAEPQVAPRRHDIPAAARYSGGMKEDWADKYRFGDSDFRAARETEAELFAVAVAALLAAALSALLGLAWFVTSIWFLPAVALVLISLAFVLAASMILSLIRCR